jgi:hypothetical protein
MKRTPRTRSPSPSTPAPEGRPHLPAVEVSLRDWWPDDGRPSGRPGPRSERVVVDEILENHTARLLRSRYDTRGRGSFDLEYWLDERVDVLFDWQVEAFVGMQAPRRLQEGDVFFLVDGELLTSGYKPVARKVARQQHLLLDWGKARSLARDQMKQEYGVLAVTQSLRVKETAARKLVHYARRTLQGWEEE